jgi:hypothetical protein
MKTSFFTLIPQKIIVRLYNLRRPFRALVAIGFTHPVGAGYNPITLSGHKENMYKMIINY